MMRVIIENIVLFLLPTLVYAGYMVMVRRGKPSEAGVLDDAPLIWLAAAGAALVLLVLVTFGSTTGGTPDQGYRPPSITDGGIEPGKVK